MYPVYKGKNSFPKERETLMINYLDKMSDDTKLIGVHKLKPGRTKEIYSFGTSRKSHDQFIKIIGSLNPSKQKLFLPLNKTS